MSTEELVGESHRLRKSGQIKEALAALKAVEVRDPSNPMLLLEKTWCFRELQDWDAAVATAELLVATYPDSAAYRGGLGTILTDADRLEEAGKAFLKSLELEEAAIAYIGLAITEMRRRLLPEAGSHLLAALSIEPGNEEAMYNLASIYRHEEDLLGSRSLLEEAIRIDPVYAAAYELLGIVMFELKEWSQAERCLRQAIALDEHSYWQWHYLAQLLQRDGRVQEAEMCLRRASGLNSES
jgi:tetratricopeptide (TPR) repeat protein